ncbi:PE family protein [Mycobacterium haemophilum DSM 44634]|uniref:PE family protein n=1 Tax=Mycobacterium haemophilum TaxID=29311 RepID=UPI000654CEA8|nr:PE family protein [Mycobacterium haemophilum]AKN16426.1 PE family protein [Mycobacterium haemophilum DSM 44634]MCV7341444.1 PE family protein [Mycobacterium haemophilum DSM 44634]
MSFVLATPDALVTAASDLAGIGSTLNAANAAAAAPTTGILAAAADQVSTQIAALFSQHAQGYQRLSAQLAAFHEQFVQAMSTSASTYAAAEANAVQTLVNAVNRPAELLLGHPLLGGGAHVGGHPAAGGVWSNVAGRIESVLLGNSGAGLIGNAFGLPGGSGAAANHTGASVLGLRPTGGARGLTAAANALLQPANLTNAAAAPAAAGSIGTAIENLYLAVEPWVQYGFNLLSYVVGWVPWIGILAPQINFFYYLFEPMVQSALFNTIDWLGGTITFSQGLSNFWAATTASVNQFIQTEVNWVLSFLPPLPPLP